MFEVDLDGNVVRLKSLAKPQSSAKKPADPEETPTTEPRQDTSSAQAPIAKDGDAVVSTSEPVIPPAEDSTDAQQKTEPAAPADTQPSEETIEDDSPWPEKFTARLSQYLSPEHVERVKALYLEGRDPPFVSDSGWGGRQARSANGEAGGAEAVGESDQAEGSESREKSGRGGRDRDRGGRGKRGGRGGGRGGRAGVREDHRKVVSEPISSKATRTGLHQAVRELFGGKLDTETDTTAPASDDGSRIVIRWSKAGGGRGGGRGGGGSDRGT